MQAAAEGAEIVDDGKVEFLGETFGMAEKIGIMPIIHLIVAQKKGVDSNDPAGLIALYEVLRDCIDQTRPQEERPDPRTGEMVPTDVGPSEWDRFEEHAVLTKADGEDLMAVVQKVYEVLSARPTRSPNGSSAGRRRISANSKVSSPRTVTPLPEDLT